MAQQRKQHCKFVKNTLKKAPIIQKPAQYQGIIYIKSPTCKQPKCRGQTRRQNRQGQNFETHKNQKWKKKNINRAKKYKQKHQLDSKKVHLQSIMHTDRKRNCMKQQNNVNTEKKQVHTGHRNAHDHSLTRKQSAVANFLKQKNRPIRLFRVVGERVSPGWQGHHMADNKYISQTCSFEYENI